MPTLTAILRVCSGILVATRKGHYRARQFGTTFRSWCKIFFACGGHQNFTSQLVLGWSSGRAESLLASELGDPSFSVLNLQRCSSCRGPQPQPQAQAQQCSRAAAGAAGRRSEHQHSEHQRSAVAATAAAAEDDAAAAVPPPPLSSELLLSVGVSSAY
jgi:hypothetical protein